MHVSFVSLFTLGGGSNFLGVFRSPKACMASEISFARAIVTLIRRRKYHIWKTGGEGGGGGEVGVNQ